MTDDPSPIRHLTWAEFAVVLATGHPPDHVDCVNCDARMYQVVTRVEWAVNVQEWFEGWSGFWNRAYDSLQLAKPNRCGCQFNVAIDVLAIRERLGLIGNPELDPTQLIRDQIDDVRTLFLTGHVCPKAPTQLELF